MFPYSQLFESFLSKAPTAITSEVVYWFLAIVFLIFFLFTIALMYHWKQYSITTLGLSKIRSTYFVVSIIILTIIVSSAASFLAQIN